MQMASLKLNSESSFFLLRFHLCDFNFVVKQLCHVLETFEPEHGKTHEMTDPPSKYVLLSKRIFFFFI